MSEKAEHAEKGTISLKISNITTYMTKIGQRTESPPQRVAGIGWHVRAYPSVIDKFTYLECYLVGASANKWVAWVNATFHIVNENGGGSGHERSFRKRLMGKEPFADNWGFQKFVTSEELLSAVSGFVVDNSVEILVDFCVTNVCGASFNVFETAGALAADIKIKVGDTVFYANKGYLSVVSSVFRDMFDLSKAAESENEMEVIELTDLDANAFKDFLGVIYPTRYPVTDANVVSLFRIADRFDAKHVLADCEGYLMGTNSVPWFDKLKLAVDLNREQLKNHLISKMTCVNLMAIKENEGLDQLGVDVLQALFSRHIDMHHV